ncbi:MAG: hypothetical protein KF791_07000 [Verrucomicrobiae bacterium]|nr:hypothetical protein [Verrucomicrobiae bacterium]
MKAQVMAVAVRSSEVAVEELFAVASDELQVQLMRDGGMVSGLNVAAFGTKIRRQGGIAKF